MAAIAVPDINRRKLGRTRDRLPPLPATAVAVRVRPVRQLATPLANRTARAEAAPMALANPSMRGLEVTIAIAALGSAVLLGLVR